MGIETTITAAELCTIGTWERVGGGYRVLDWEAATAQRPGLFEDAADSAAIIMGREEQLLQLGRSVARSGS